MASDRTDRPKERRERAGGAVADEAPPGAEGKAPPDEGALLAKLREGDEAAFAGLVDRYHNLMVRVASMYVPSRATAEEVVQETWLAVIKGIDRFEGRSSLKTWMFRILTNRARTRGVREGRSVPFSSLWKNAEPSEPAVDPSRFGPNKAGQIHWRNPPSSWGDQPDKRLLGEEAKGLVLEAIETLPPNQKAVITMRDIQGWEARDVCDALEISEANQRVLLHRARTKVRRALEQYLDAA